MSKRKEKTPQKVNRDALARRALKTWIARLNLGHWEIKCDWETEPGGAETNLGASEANYANLCASIDLLRTLETNRIEEIVLHELLHVVLSPLTHACFDVIGSLPDGAHKSLAQTAVNNGEEQIVRLLVRSLLKHFNSA